MKKRVVASVVAVVLAICCVVGGTLAWLTDKTDEVKNTFTVGNVDITLAETTGNDYKIVPGCNIAKDPTVTVKANSEDCYVFVKVDETNWPTAKVEYSMSTDWTPLQGNEGVYYRVVGTSNRDQEFGVLNGNQITVSEELTTAEMQTISQNGTPSLTFTAYAIQLHKDGVDFTAAEAWDKVSK